MRLVITIFLLSIYSGGFSQENHGDEFEHHCHFAERSVTFGIASPYSFHLKTPGVNLRMYYNWGEKVCFGPEYAYFKEKDKEIVDFDFVIHYVFETKWVGIYPVVGANYTIEMESHEEKEAAAEAGLVFGGGIHRNIKKWTLFAEYSRVEFGIADEFLTIGLMHTFK